MAEPASRPREIRPQAGPQETFCASPADIAIYGGSAFGGKMLPLSTPIPTPTGWTTMGELRVGDMVISDEGVPTMVTWLSDVDPLPDAYELTFDDGAKIRACGDHQWVTLTYDERLRLLRTSEEWREGRRAKRASRGTGKRPDLAERNAARAVLKQPPPNPRGSVRTTREIADTLYTGRRANHAIVNPAPLALPHADLPIPPYVLGAWLGDGTSVSGGLTSADPELVESVRARGYEVRRVPSSTYGYTVVGLSTQLRALGLRSNKHIPAAYLRASMAQRLELLQGLCDTDGFACKLKGSVEFTTTLPALRDGVLELLATLGIKPSCREGVAKLNGRTIGPKWRIQFWTSLPAFELQRKLARQRRDNADGRRSKRFIVDARACASEPMRCIGVDAPSHCYLAGREMIVTHNSWALVFEAARYTQVQGYSAVIFRRTSPQLTGGGSIWEETKKLYPLLGGVPKASPNLQWNFAAGALVQFMHMQHEDDANEHQGKQYDFIGFDEVTHFTAYQFWYLLSRLRSGNASIPRRMRGTCNPDPDSFVRELLDWWIDEKTGLAIPERSGVLRWFVRIDNVLYWGASPEELYAQFGDRVRRRGEDPTGDDDQRPSPMSLTFTRAAARDNKIGLAADPEYLSRLAAIPGAASKRLLQGNWNARDTAGAFFNRSTFPVDTQLPAPERVRRRVRFWDKAATPVSETNKDPDWTAGPCIWELDAPHLPALPGVPGGVEWLVADLIALREGPAIVEATMLAAAEADGTDTMVGCWQDPGQAGVVDVAHMQTLFADYSTQFVRSSRDKAVYAGVWAKRAQAGRVRVMQHVARHPLFFQQLEAFPDGRTHDDVVDGCSGCFQVFTGGITSFEHQSVPDTRHAAPKDTSRAAALGMYAPADDDEPSAGRSGGHRYF